MGLVLTRRQAPIVYPGNNAKQVIQLNKSLVIRELILRLTGQLTLAGASNTVAATKQGDEWALVKKIEIVANGADVLFSMTGEQLAKYNRVGLGSGKRLVVALGDGATANPSFDTSLILPLWMWRASRPYDTALDSSQFSDLRLEVTFGTFTDVNAAATAFTANPAMEVGSHENSLSSDPKGQPVALRRTIVQQLAVVGASASFRFPLDVGPRYKSFVINTKDNAGTPVDSTGIFSNVKLVSGSTVFFDMSEPMLRQYHQLRTDCIFGQEKDSTGICRQVSYDISSSANQDAWYVIELCTDGLLTESIDTSQFNEFYLEFTTLAAGTIFVISNQLLPLPGR
jgi:hypothetical protein